MTLRHWTFVGGLLAATFAVGWFTGQSHAQAAKPPLVYELRTYTAVEGRLPALNKRFREHTTKLFEKHGMKNVIYLTPIGKENGEDNKLLYLLAYESQESAAKSWAAFRSDPDWNKARAESEKDGKIVEKAESLFLRPTDYSPMK